MKIFKLKTKYFLLSSLIFGSVFIFGAAQKTNAAYGLSENIRQVKTAESPDVYYLDHKRGVKKAYLNPQSYLAYGNKWKDIKIISEIDLAKWPDLRLVSSAETKDIYYLSNNKKTLINSSDFKTLEINPADAVNIHPIDLASYPIASREEFDLNYSGIIAALDDSSPADVFLAPDTPDNLLGVFSFFTKKDQAIINSLQFKLEGILNPNVIKKIYLTQEDNKEVDIPAVKDGKKFEFRFDSPLVLRNNSPLKIKVFADFDVCANCLNATAGISLEKIKSEDQIINMPLSAALFRFADTGGLLGKLTWEEKYTNFSNNLVIGNTNQIIGKFSIGETSGNEKIKLTEITFINNGSASGKDLANFKLKLNNKIIAQSLAFDDNKINFKVSQIINKKSTEEFTVTADIINGNAKTINLGLDKIKASGESYGLSLNTPDPKEINETLNIGRENLSVLALDLKSSKSVFAKQSGVIIGNFQIRNINQKIQLQSFDLALAKSAKAPNLESSIYLADYKTGEIYGSINGKNLSAGTTNVRLNSLEVLPRKDITISLITDMPANAKNGDSYQVYLKKIYYRADNRQYYEESADAPGVVLSISRSSLYLYPGKESDHTYTKGQAKVKIGSFLLEIPADNDVVLNTLVLGKSDNSSGDITFSNGFSNLKAYIGDSFCSVIEEPASGTFEFSGCAKKLKSGQKYKIEIYVDTAEDLKVSSAQLMLIDVFATDYTSGFPANINFPTDEVAHKIQGESSSFYGAAIDITNNEAGSITAGQKNNIAGSFVIKNTGGEDLRLSQLIIATSNAGFSYTLGYSNLRAVRRYNAEEVATIGKVSNPVAGSNKLSLNYIIKPKAEFFLDIYVDADNNIPLESFKIYLNGLTAYGSKSKINAKINGLPTKELSVNIN